MSVVPMRIMQTGRVNVPALNSRTYQSDEWAVLAGVFGATVVDVTTTRGILTVSEQSTHLLGVRDQSA